ncbi:MAG: hypothetical protein DSM106950_27795 [Stigonema ocellatum SAG 48.90 = DSM 106950]|nr:hypothetical protein [Stigonema ocellatum SAG 48.90 = DSM 106950]
MFTAFFKAEAHQLKRENPKSFLSKRVLQGWEEAEVRALAAVPIVQSSRFR